MLPVILNTLFFGYSLSGYVNDDDGPVQRACHFPDDYLVAYYVIIGVCTLLQVLMCVNTHLASTYTDVSHRERRTCRK